MNSNELTFLFTFGDGFYQALFHTSFKKKLRYHWENKRGPKKKLTFEDSQYSVKQACFHLHDRTARIK